jgi:hypothetical protein
MTLYEKCDRLIKAGVQKERGFLSDLRNDLYKNKGDETEINVHDVQSVNKLYNLYFDRASKRG